MYQFKKYNIKGSTLKNILGILLLVITACVVIYEVFSFFPIIGVVFGLFTMAYLGTELVGLYSHSNYDWIFRIFVLVSGYVLLPVNIFIYKISEIGDFYLIFGWTIVVWIVSLVIITINRYFHQRNKY